jgi:CRP-like cAMP-binding protein
MGREAEKVPDFHALLSKAAAGQTVQTLKARKIVFAQGDAADASYYIQRGQIKLAGLSEGGKEAVLAILGQGDFTGLNCLVGQLHRPFTASTLTECVLTRFEPSALHGMIEQDPAFAKYMISYLLKRGIKLQGAILDHLTHSSEKRLARLLLVLADFGEDDRAEVIVPRISQELLADMIGTTRSRVNTFMNEFRRQGFIDYGTELCIRKKLFQVLLRD